MEKNGLHNEHRKRMRDRFRKSGLSSFKDHEVLEMLLFSAIPRKNTNPVAHSLLERFGDISGVISAEKRDICSVDGVGSSTAEYLMFLGEIYSKITENLFGNVTLDTEDKVGMYAVLMMGTVPAGSAAAVYLDDCGICISRELLYRGEGKLTDELCGYIVSKATDKNAVSVILMHDHRNEPSVPSPEDISMTEMLRSATELAGIKKVWHVIVSDDGYTHI